MTANENQIVVYPADETIRPDVRPENGTVWLTPERIANLLGAIRPAISNHPANIYKSGEFYNPDAILSVRYRANSRHATLFRRWAPRIFKAYLPEGHAVNTRMRA